MSEENNKKTEQETTKKQMFVKGGKPGPGRGHKKIPEFEPLGQDEFEGVIAEGLRSKDGKERAVWARVMLAYEKQIGKSKDGGPTLDPLLQAFFSLLWDYCEGQRQRTGQPISQIEACDIITRHLKTCPTSPLSNIEFDVEVIE